jgi:hypothetical protein
MVYNMVDSIWYSVEKHNYTDTKPCRKNLVDAHGDPLFTAVWRTVCDSTGLQITNTIKDAIRK